MRESPVKHGLRGVVPTSRFYEVEGETRDAGPLCFVESGRSGDGEAALTRRFGP
jgi:hypothetical protein